jgi:subtilisin family serine protease
MKRFPRQIRLCAILISLLWPSAGPASEVVLDPALLRAIETSQGGTRFPVLLQLRSNVSLKKIEGSKLQRGREVFRRLRARAPEQAALQAWLGSRGISSRSLWIAGVVAAELDSGVLGELANRSDLAAILLDAPVRFDLPTPSSEPLFFLPEAVEWGVQKIRAPEVWSLGVDGDGVVVGGQDTGYRWDHAALKNQYRGWNGSSVDHNYHWHDAIHSGGGSCGANSPVPCDDHNHGTHTMGTIVGDDGGTNQIGVAPGARWIGCRNMDQGVGTLSTYLECFQWFLAPTDLAGNNPNPDLAPDVINNSWGCPPEEGCNSTNWSVMEAAIEALRAAGIVVVVSAGNSGPACSSVSDPPAIFEGSFSVGSTTSSDTLSSFSSRGPVTVDGSNRLKPNVVAPGSSVRSALKSTPTSYGTMSGTSMAGPHVAGAVALLISAHPALRGKVELLELLLEKTAVPTVSGASTCGGIPPTTIPNPSFGWGRIDAFAAVQAVLLADDFELGSLCRWDAVGDPPAPACP